MKSNEALQRNVQDAIKWEPLLHAAEIGVTVHDGIVTLTGSVDNYLKKLEAENATKNVAGVRGIVEKIEVHHHDSWDKKDDNDIAEAVLDTYKWNWKIPNDKVQVKVEKGWVKLTGELSWNFQKDEAKNAIKNLEGIVAVTNNITIKSETANELEKEVIERHLKRSWSLNVNDIEVEVNGTNVSLNGKVGSLYQKEEAGRIAWNTPGIWTLNNNLNVDYNLNTLF